MTKLLNFLLPPSISHPIPMEQQSTEPVDYSSHFVCDSKNVDFTYTYQGQTYYVKGDAILWTNGLCDADNVRVVLNHRVEDNLPRPLSILLHEEVYEHLSAKFAKKPGNPSIIMLKTDF